MFLHRLDGHFLPVKDPSNQGGLCLGLFKDLRKVFNFPGSGKDN
jgi:hypothetical protein